MNATGSVRRRSACGPGRRCGGACLAALAGMLLPRRRTATRGTGGQSRAVDRWRKQGRRRAAGSRYRTVSPLRLVVGYNERRSVRARPSGRTYEARSPCCRSRLMRFGARPFWMRRVPWRRRLCGYRDRHRVPHRPIGDRPGGLSRRPGRFRFGYRGSAGQHQLEQGEHRRGVRCRHRREHRHRHRPDSHPSRVLGLFGRKRPGGRADGRPSVSLRGVAAAHRDRFAFERRR